jgi:hypothetical protein
VNQNQTRSKRHGKMFKKAHRLKKRLCGALQGDVNAGEIPYMT